MMLYNICIYVLVNVFSCRTEQRRVTLQSLDYFHRCNTQSWRRDL